MIRFLSWCFLLVAIPAFALTEDAAQNLQETADSAAVAATPEEDSYAPDAENRDVPENEEPFAEKADSSENVALAMPADDPDTEPECSLDSAVQTDLSDSSLAASALDFSDWFLPTVHATRITSPYGIRHYRLHRGIDVKVFKGDSIVAAHDGKVIKAAYERRGYGHYILLEHPNGTRTLYGHLSKRLVKIGDEVSGGSLIGLGGNTGRSTGSHLHFEIRYKDINISPEEVFNFPDGVLAENAAKISTEVARADHLAIQQELSKYRIYRVKKGDTLGAIARKYGTSVEKICRLNRIKRNSVLRIGQRLRCS